MNLLSELNQISNLTDAQKTVLAMAQFSAQPKQAYAATTGSDKLVYARDSLARIGYVTVVNGEMSLTGSGQNAVTQYNLADESGQPTDDAVALLQGAHQDQTVAGQTQDTTGQEQSDF